MTDALRKLGLLIGGVLLSILVAEGILRLGTNSHFLEGEPVGGFEWMKHDPVIGWKNCNQHWGEGYDNQERMDWTRANINSLGFRGPEMSLAKPSGKKRIVLIGDSGTFGVMNVGKGYGWRFTPIESYPGQLAQIFLRAGLKNTEVINAGVVGYSASHGLRQFVTQILPLDPDVLIVRFGANDVETPNAPERLSFEPRSRVVRWLLYRFHSWRLGRLALDYYQSLPIHPDPMTKRVEPYKQFRFSMERIIEVARDRGVQVVLMDYQVSPSKRCNYLSRPLSRINLIVHEYARTYQLPIVNSKTAFANATAPMFAESDCIHPNPDAARILARLIFEELRIGDLLGPTSH